MPSIKNAYLENRSGRNPVFVCELQFEPAEIGKSFQLESEYYGKKSRLSSAEIFGPFKICQGEVLIPDKTDFVFQKALGHTMDRSFILIKTAAKVTKEIQAAFESDWKQ